MAAACADLIHADVRRLPGFVRVAFHDCVSGCDGCINVGLTGGHNAGKTLYSQKQLKCHQLFPFHIQHKVNVEGA